jgi:hypothetical protein
MRPAGAFTEPDIPATKTTPDKRIRAETVLNWPKLVGVNRRSFFYNFFDLPSVVSDIDPLGLAAALHET